MTMTVKDILQLFDGAKNFTGDSSVVVRAVQIDSRQVMPNDIFVAIHGDKQDGHDFIADALQKGACLCLSEKKTSFEKTIVCDDSIRALATMANWYRKKLKSPLIAITGSSGKTTTKDLLQQALSAYGKTQATAGNFNNHLGLPLTLLSFATDADFSIVEMGMNASGEIAALCQIAEPNIGLITNVGPAHLEKFSGRIENIAKAKGELFAALGTSQTAVINLDDPFVSGLPTQAQRITFGFLENADVRGDNLVLANNQSTFDVMYSQKTLKVRLPLVGKHHAQNALAVLAVIMALGLDPEKAVGSFRNFVPNSRRGRFIDFSGGTIMDDSYNANPSSMRAAFETLCHQFPTHQKIAVLGDMFELGDSAAKWHEQVGQAAKEMGVGHLYVLGENAGFYVQGFGQKNATHFENANSLVRQLYEDLQTKQEPVAILFKGSRGMKMENCLAELMQQLTLQKTVKTQAEK